MGNQQSMPSGQNKTILEGSDKQQLVGYHTYSPFIHVDKKFVADIYRKNNLMEDLYPLTGSCVGTELVTDYFTKECRQCFWCHEKKWAFNLVWD